MSASGAESKTAVIIEDDPEVRRLLVEVLEAAGFSTVSVGNGLDGVRAVLTYRPLLTTLDIHLPGIDGFESARRIRAASDTYIIMLTGLNEEADVITGLNAGADEYLAKPFRPRELRARVEAITRRASQRGQVAPPAATPVPSGQGDVGPTFPGVRPAAAPAPNAPRPDAGQQPNHPATPAADAEDVGWLVHRDLRLHPDNRIAMRGDDELDLTRTEFDLLATLLDSKRRVRSKADLTLMLRGESYVTSYFVGDADKRAVEAHMTNLRRKLGDNPANPRYIETVRGVGYRLTSA
ncbi:response regulator transcription factor [Microbacterium sp. BWT-B31]|uniref:response regulator transcription factor n=1 Tax=Microbacterium sp. BWT-B31 TaxID=3232072 RepID=UPI003527E9B8